MRFIKQSARARPKVSLILLDWSVRESFHLLHYLARQNVSRDLFEIIVIEYYSRVSDAVGRFKDEVDSWVLLEMPESCYYHKHLMYNAGIVVARGELCVICDSDAMVRESFIGTILGEFERDPNMVLHIDQFRNMRRDFYPFNFPGFDEVLGTGCANNVDGKPRGVVDDRDPLHTRNYGACMCARRDDLIAIGGADEHIDFLGHICGPYDMTFRLVNKGRRELWHQSEFMLHTWHPGQAGVDNYLGPHDGRHVSTTALDALVTGRVMSLVENAAIRDLRTGRVPDAHGLADNLIRADAPKLWDFAAVSSGAIDRRLAHGPARIRNYKGFGIYHEDGRYYAHLLLEPDRGWQPAKPYHLCFEGESASALCGQIDRALSIRQSLVLMGGRVFILLWLLAAYTWSKGIRPLLPGQRSALATISLPRTDSLKRLRWRFDQFVQEYSQLADALGDIIPNLDHLCAARQDLAEGGVPALLIDSKRFEVYLRLLASIRAVPRVRVAHVTSAPELQVFLARRTPPQPEPPLIFARGTYVRFYTVMKSGFRARDVAII